MVESGLDELSCSLHGASQATFAIYQPGKDFRKTIDKIKCLIETQKSMGKNTPKVRIIFVVTRLNEHEIPAFKKLAHELKCEYAFSTPSLNMRFLNDRESVKHRGDSVASRMNKWLPSNPEYIHPLHTALLNGQLNFDRLDRFNGHKLIKCVWPWEKAIINWDGTVGPCCGAWSEADTLGDISREPLGQVWNGLKYRAARRSFKRATDVDVPCARCPGTLF
jgi:MoaA/NifB/PqqE/SkfB family radical SAM enzyme